MADSASANTITPGGASGGSNSRPNTPPRTPARTPGTNIAVTAHPPTRTLGPTMYCTTTKLLASVVGPMIALQLGKDPAEISDLLEKYLSSHNIDNDKCLAAVHDSLPDPKANSGDQGAKTLTLPSTNVL